MNKERFIREIEDIQKPLRRFLLVLCGGDTFTADDIAQDACVKAWIACEGFRGTSKFSTWIFKIAYNSWRDRKYNVKNSTGLDSDTVQQIPDMARADGTFQYQNLYCAIENLNCNEKTAILLFYMEDRGIKEISTIMDIPQGTVKSLLSRGRAKLRIKLESE